MSSSASLKENIKLLPQRVPVTFQWKVWPPIKGVLVRSPYYGLHIIPEGSKKPKHLRHLWNSYIKEHEKDATVRSMLRSISELDLLGHLFYKEKGDNFQTILTECTPDGIRALERVTTGSDWPVLTPSLLEQDRTWLKLLTPGEVFIETYNCPQLKATLEADGTFTYKGAKGLSSFLLLHHYKMEIDPMIDDIQEDAQTDPNVALCRIFYASEGTGWRSSLAERIRTKNTAIAPAPAPAPASASASASAPAPAPVTTVAGLGPIISEEVRLKEKTALAKLFKTGDGPKKVYLRSIKVDCTAWLQPSGMFSENQNGTTGFRNLHSLQLLHHKNYLADYDLSQKTDTILGQLCIYLETDIKMNYNGKRIFEKNIRKHILDMREAEKKASNATSSANATASSAPAPVEAKVEAKVEVAAKVEAPAPPAPAPAPAKVEAPAPPAPAPEAKVEAKVEAPPAEPPLSLSVQLKALEEREAKLKSEVEMLLFERKAKEQAVHQAKIRVEQLEADLLKIKADLA